jgi:aspartate kinase
LPAELLGRIISSLKVVTGGKMEICIMKFGGASVAQPQCFLSIAELIIEKLKMNSRLVVVVSAMGDTTNRLLDLAKRVHPNPPRREQDMLVSVGERVSISLLAMALARYGCEAISFTGSQSGIITNEAHSEAKIVEVRPKRILETLSSGRVAIVAGFQGVSRQGEITTLGRGGSDTTAVALGAALGSEVVEFYKDVGGIFESDPHLNPTARRIERLSYKDATDLMQGGGRVLHSRCISLAERNGIRLQVYPFEKSKSNELGSVVGWNAVRKPECIYEQV